MTKTMFFSPSLFQEQTTQFCSSCFFGTQRGQTVLMHAVMRGHSKLVELLLKYGANINDEDNVGVFAACYILLWFGKES